MKNKPQEINAVHREMLFNMLFSNILGSLLEKYGILEMDCCGADSGKLVKLAEKISQKAFQTIYCED